MATANRLTESKYNAIKIILHGGATNMEAAKYMQVSTATVCRVKASETFEEYKNTVAEKTLAARKARENERKAQSVAKEPEKPAQIKQEAPATQVVEYRQNVTIQATHFMMQELQKTNEYLKQISAKLAYIVEDLYGTGKKEG